MKLGSMQAATTSERYWRKWWRSRLFAIWCSGSTSRNSSNQGSAMRSSKIVFVALILAATISIAESVGASETPGRVAPLLPEMSTEQQIELAMSAAPSHISQKATIYVLGPNGYVQDRIGTNGFSCLVERQYLGTLEPSCYDAEGSATTLRARLYREELRAAKMSEEEIEKLINEGYTTGALMAPSKPGLVHMLSPHNQVHNDRTNKIINVPPHLMFYFSAALAFPRPAPEREPCRSHSVVLNRGRKPGGARLEPTSNPLTLWLSTSSTGALTCLK
jgi:hypothetical protein